MRPNSSGSFYVEGPERARRVEDLFGAIASRYDLINDLQSFGLHRLWKARLLRMAAIKQGDRALDLCAGTGDIARGLARTGAFVAALDFSEPMLRVAQHRPQEGLAYLRADALNIPFADETFDAVTISYGLRNLASLERGLQEMWRVTRPGGRLLILDFGKPKIPIWRACYFFYLKRIVPLFGKLFCGDSATHAYILESLLKYPGQNEVAARMRDLGCERVEVVNLLGGVMSINYGEKQSSALP